MMGFPIVTIGIFTISSILFLIVISLFNLIQPKLFPNRPLKIPIYWPFIFAILVVAWFIYGMMTFEGPWIN